MTDHQSSRSGGPLDNQLTGQIHSQLRLAKRPATLLAGPYGHPFHPILVPVPIGVWVASLAFDIASRVSDDPGFLARGSLWLIGIGVVGAAAAGLVGLLDLMAIPPRTRAFRTGLLHAGVNTAVISAYAVNFALRRPADDGSPVGVGPLALSIVSLAALSLAGYLGGKLAFRYGVRVVEEETQAEGFRDTTRPAQPGSPG